MRILLMTKKLQCHECWRIITKYIYLIESSKSLNGLKGWKNWCLIIQKNNIRTKNDEQIIKLDVKMEHKLLFFPQASLCLLSPRNTFIKNQQYLETEVEEGSFNDICLLWFLFQVIQLISWNFAQLNKQVRCSLDWNSLYLINYRLPKLKRGDMPLSCNLIPISINVCIDFRKSDFFLNKFREWFLDFCYSSTTGRNRNFFSKSAECQTPRNRVNCNEQSQTQIH